MSIGLNFFFAQYALNRAVCHYFGDCYFEVRDCFYSMFLHDFRAMVVEVAVVVPCGRPASNLPEVGKSKLKGETASIMGEVELEEESQSVTLLGVSIATTQTPVVDRRDPEETLNQEVLA